VNILAYFNNNKCKLHINPSATCKPGLKSGQGGQGGPWPRAHNGYPIEGPCR